MSSTLKSSIEKIFKGAGEGIISFIATLGILIGILSLFLGYFTPYERLITDGAIILLISVAVKGIVKEFLHN